MSMLLVNSPASMSLFNFFLHIIICIHLNLLPQPFFCPVLERNMANEECKTLQESWAMAGGTGPLSYNQNSSGQKEVMDAAKEIIKQGIINNLDLTSNPFQIADFGCSVGPNTFSAVQNIIEAVNLKHDNKSDPLEFHVFFNDVTGNDFNTLFKSIPSPNKYFAAGVPGSFFSRLFPCSSLQIAHSCYALHWLSTVPKEAVDRNSTAWNKDSIYCTGLDPEVAKAYSGQFKKDVGTFLSARGEEIVEGGLLIILMAGLPDGVLFSQTDIGYLYHLLGSSLVDLAKLGVLSEEKVESFNLPLHYAYTEELEEVVRSIGCFNIEYMEMLKHPFKGRDCFPAKFIVANMRAVFEGVVKQQFGNDEEQLELIFQHFTDNVADNFYLSGEMSSYQHIDHFMLLKRNSTPVCSLQS